MTESVLLEVRDLTVSFDTDRGRIHAVDGVTFTVGEGHVLGIVGETGCGKSVTGRAVMGVLPQGAWVQVHGTIHFKGRNLLGLGEKEMNRLRGSAISMIFQEPGAALNPTLKIGLQVAEVIERHLGGSRSHQWRYAVELLERVGIPSPEEKAHLYPHQLSGGMKQRAMIASAIACEPSLLIADEPTTALDVTIQAQILDLIMSLRDNSGTSVLLISHDLGIIAETCDEVAVMYLGRIVEKGTVAEFFARPLHPYSRGLMDAIPLPRDERMWLPTIPGTVRQGGSVGGCNFADRCPRAQAVCFQEKPQWVREGSHSVLCFNPMGGR